jgi:hypothetical protein
MIPEHPNYHKMKTKISLIAVTVLYIFMISACTKAKLDPTVTTTQVSQKAEKVIAQAQADTVLNLPKDSLTLRGKSGNPKDTIVGYLWSQISGPNEAIINNESSAAATAKGLIAGKYLFQFMVIDKSGLNAIDTVGVTVVPSQVVMVTLNLSPSNNPYETNVGILGGQDASNHTSIEEPLCAWTINGTPITVRNLIKFDLSSIPANATILSADLYMYSDTIPKNGDLVNANSGADNSFVVQQVASSWDPSTVTWFNQPASLTTNQVVIPTTPLSFLNMDINVKDMISSMVSTNANYGFKLMLQNEVMYVSRIFCSSYYQDASRHPKLIVKYSKN